VLEEVDWKKIFPGGKPPAYLDIGCGMGKLFMELALNNSDENYLGLEVRKNAVEWVSKVIEGEKIPNAKILWYSIVNGMKFIDDNSIKKIFYLFPDPWIKTRHRKRRAFNNFVIGEIFRMLKGDGTLYIMSDVPEAVDYHINKINDSGLFSTEFVSEENWDLPITTNHEEFCNSKDIPFVRIICKKR
jgi:tRNA (guanine-N7-)-methyltransferase